MTSWLRYLLIGGASAVAIGAATYFGLHYLNKPPSTPSTAATTSSTSPDFTKTPYKVDSSGNLVPFTGPVHPGDVIEYVLTYTPPANGSSGPVTITDTLSSNQTYVDPSIQAPGWTFPTPGYAGNTETYTGTGLGTGGSAVLSVPAISGTSGAPGGGGDGFEPIPVVTSAGTKVFAVNHHMQQASTIMCWIGASLAVCPGYPKQAATLPTQLPTATWTHGGIFNKKIYFPAGRYDNTTKATLEFGIGCWNAETDTSCPFVSLPGTPSVAYNAATYFGSDGTYLGGYLVGVRADPSNPSHMFVYAQDKVYCVDVSTTAAPACWSTPATISPDGNTRYRDMIIEENGTRVFVSNSSGHLFCLNMSDGSTCTSWPATGVDGGTASSWSLGPGIDASGTAMTSVCMNFSLPSAFKCFSVNNGAPATIWPAAVASNWIFAAYHIPGLPRVLYPGFSNAPVCYDTTTSLPCTPAFTPYWFASSWTGGNVQDYGYAADPQAPQSCIYGHGNAGILVRFKLDGTAAGRECAPKTYTTTYSLSDQYCAQKPHSATWTTLDIANRPNELGGGTIVIKDSNGAVLQTITVTAANSYTVNLPATGASGTVSIEFTPDYGTNAPPATDYQLKLNYTADSSPQICYKTTIKDCTDGSTQGPVTNKAVYTDATGTKEADVNLGNVVGGHCGPPPCLHLSQTVVLNPDGTATVTITGSGPPGFNSEIVEVHSSTPGVSVTPPSRTFPPGPFTATWTLSGVTPGESVDLRIDAVDPGAGSKGGDKCCSSTVTIVIPPGGQTGHQTDVGIQKTGTSEGQGPANGSGYIYTLSVTNFGIPINGQNIIVVTDTVPAGLSFANASGTDWNCVGPFPLAAGGTLTCTYTGAAMLATGQVLPPITVVSTNPAQGTQLPRVTNCADVGFVFGNGIMDTNPSNNRSCTTNGQTSRAANVMVTKTAVVDGHATKAPGEAFPITARCTEPNGAMADLSYTASARSGFSTSMHSLPLGTRCTVHEPSPPPPPGHRQCHWTTSYAFNGAPVTAFPVTIAAAVQPSNVLGVTNVLACETQPPTRCDLATTKASGGACACLYPDMRNSRANPSQCVCRVGTVLEPGHGCVVPEKTCTETDEHWNGHSCVACPHGGVWDSSQNSCVKKEACDDNSTIARGGSCLCRYPTMTQTSPTRCMCPQGSTLRPGVGCTQQTACHDPMIPNAAGTACVCPEGTKPKNGSCVKKSSVLDNILNNVHVGVGGGGSGGHRGGGGETDGHPGSSGKPDRQPVDNGPVPH